LTGCGDDSVSGQPDGGSDGPADAPRGDGPSPGACDPVRQDCPSGQRCTLNHMLPVNLTFCEMSAGVGGEYQGCTPNQSSDDCQAGNVCLMTGTARTCRHFCNSDMDCSGGTNVCAIPIGGTVGASCAMEST